MESCEKLFRRQIDQLDLIGFVEDVVRQGLALAHAGELRDEIVEALEMLYVDRRPDADPRFEQLLDVLPSLGMAHGRLAACEIGVGKLIDEQNVGMALERGVEVEFLAGDAP